jgi:hypothetical protein
MSYEVALLRREILRFDSDVPMYHHKWAKSDFEKLLYSIMVKSYQK